MLQLEHWVITMNLKIIKNTRSRVQPFSIFNKGIITASEIIDIGGDNIDYDLGYVYKINSKRLTIY